jgi:multidrug efflux pump subunit AcrA (membrane-fusion protein)
MRSKLWGRALTFILLLLSSAPPLSAQEERALTLQGVVRGDLNKIDRESPATIRGVDGGAPWMGRPIYAGEVIDSLKRTASLLYEVNNSDGRLKLGMSVTIEVPTGPKKQMVMVPEAALTEDEGGKGFVYLRKGSTLFIEEEVSIGIRQDGLVAVQGGVKEGDEVVGVGAPELSGEVTGYLSAPEEE